MFKYEIHKSYKKPGYAAIKKGFEKWTLRKLWDKEDGTFIVRIDNVDYRFNWDAEGKKAENVVEDKFFTSKAGTLKSIKAELKAKNIQIPEVLPEAPKDTEEAVKHEKFLQIKTCVENNIPVYLVGPAGSGKNHTLEQIAEELELDFYFTNSIQQEFKLTGFIDAGGKFHETEFYKAFNNGGLFFLDEMVQVSQKF